jgi:quercetin dioxygenase-like cupin family protein
MEPRSALSAFAVQPTEGDVLVPGRAFLRISARQTDGAVEVLEVTGPEGDGPPPHIHHERDELFYVLQGKAEFTLGQEQAAADAGSFVFIPRNTRHGFKLGRDAKLLVWVAPAGLEGFFRELGAGMAAGKPHEEFRRTLEDKYDQRPA